MKIDVIQNKFQVEQHHCSLGVLWGGIYPYIAIQYLKNFTDMPVVTTNVQMMKKIKVNSTIKISHITDGNPNIPNFTVYFWLDDDTLAATLQIVCGRSKYNFDKDFSKAPLVTDFRELQDQDIWSGFLSGSDFLLNSIVRWPNKLDSSRDKVLYLKINGIDKVNRENYTIFSDYAAAIVNHPLPEGSYSRTLISSSHYNRDVESDWALCCIEFISVNENFCNMRNRIFSTEGVLIGVSTFTNVVLDFA